MSNIRFHDAKFLEDYFEFPGNFSDYNNILITMKKYEICVNTVNRYSKYL